LSKKKILSKNQVKRHPVIGKVKKMKNGMKVCKMSVEILDGKVTKRSIPKNGNLST
jgi:hypothetical protein